MVDRLDELRPQLTGVTVRPHSRRGRTTPGATHVRSTRPTMTRTTTLHTAAALAATLIAAAACQPIDASDTGVPRTGRQHPAAQLAAEPGRRAPVHVDSIFPIEEEIRRFREGLEPARRLQDAAASRDELVRRFVNALAAADAAGLRALAITVEEFAWLYYPHSRYVRPPYELAPALLWFQLDAYGARDLDRALRRHGGRPIDAVGHTCDEPPTVEERNRIWSGCSLLLHDGTALPVLGTILEREGRFKFLSPGNRL